MCTAYQLAIIKSWKVLKILKERLKNFMNKSGHGFYDDAYNLFL